jgi:post-segregation antitoxin (ccd killing protein)
MNKERKPGNRLSFIESGVSEREEVFNAITEATQGRKSRYTFNLPDALMEHARAAVYHTPGLNLSALVEQALEAEIRRLERARGDAFPRRTAAIKVGRPPAR